MLDATPAADRHRVRRVGQPGGATRRSTTTSPATRRTTTSRPSTTRRSWPRPRSTTPGCCTSSRPSGWPGCGRRATGRRLPAQAPRCRPATAASPGATSRGTTGRSRSPGSSTGWAARDPRGGRWGPGCRRVVPGRGSVATMTEAPSTVGGPGQVETNSRRSRESRTGVRRRGDYKGYPRGAPWPTGRERTHHGYSHRPPERTSGTHAPHSTSSPRARQRVELCVGMFAPPGGG